MKLLIQIPCFNEEQTLPQVLKDLPRQLPGIDLIEYLVVDDGSSDRTVEVAQKLGVRHIIELKKNKGLATAFKAGMDFAIAHGFDILVNTDGDNQYCGADIGRLVSPIVEARADLVVGSRPIANHPEFSFIKKRLQKVGSAVLRNLSNTEVEDAASGFRAYSYDALCRLVIYSEFSYCMETLIQAGRLNLRVLSTDIGVNPKTRDSRLFKSVYQYLFNSSSTMINVYLLYRAKKVFYSIAAVLFIFSLSLILRYFILIKYFDAPRGSFWPTIVFSGIAVAVAFQSLFTGILANLIAGNRKLSEEILYRLRKDQREQD